MGGGRNLSLASRHDEIHGMLVKEDIGEIEDVHYFEGTPWCSALQPYHKTPYPGTTISFPISVGLASLQDPSAARK
jgi:hypothetical protein